MKRNNCISFEHKFHESHEWSGVPDGVGGDIMLVRMLERRNVPCAIWAVQYYDLTQRRKVAQILF